MKNVLDRSVHRQITELQLKTENLRQENGEKIANVYREFGSLLQENENLRQEINKLTELQLKTENLRQGNEEKIANLHQEIETARQEIVNLKKEENDLRKSVLRRGFSIAKRQKENITESQDSSRPSLTETKSIDYYFNELKRLAPRAFPLWRDLLDVNKRTYDGFPVHSCSVEGHYAAELFGNFVFPYLAGRVLDIGCGPQPVPLYLQDYPVGLISGIDPISSPEDHPFEFVRGVGEFLAWGSNVFDVVIAATSLDHVLLLDRVYSEIHRVLLKKGRFLVWMAFVKAAEPYDPFKPDLRPVDKYHLFHFDEGWFKEGVEKYFTIEEEFKVTSEIDHYFYSLIPRVL